MQQEDRLAARLARLMDGALPDTYGVAPWQLAGGGDDGLKGGFDTGSLSVVYGPGNGATVKAQMHSLNVDIVGEGYVLVPNSTPDAFAFVVRTPDDLSPVTTYLDGLNA